MSTPPVPQQVTLQESYNVGNNTIPEVPETLKRVVGLRIGGKLHPAMILSKELLDTFEWTCRSSRKTKRIVNHLKEEVGRLNAQDFRQQQENVGRQREIQALRATLDDISDASLFHSYENRIAELEKTRDIVEEERRKWTDLSEELADTCVNEGIFHGSRMMKASVPLEEYLERSGMLKFDAKAYLEEARVAAPALRSHYHYVRNRTQEIRQNAQKNKINNLDADNCTQTGIATQDDTLSELNALVAEFCCRKQELHLAQREFDDRAEWKRRHMSGWRDLGAAGADRPSRSEADMDCLMEDRRKARALQKAQDAVTELRSRLREHIAVSDVDSYVPNHVTPIKGVRHTRLVRDAVADERFLDWCDNVSSKTFGPPPSQRSISLDLSEPIVVHVEDAYSMSEKDSFIASRKRGWEKIQASRQGENAARFGPLPNEGSSDGSSSRRRRRSTTSTSSYSSHSNKRHCPWG